MFTRKIRITGLLALLCCVWVGRAGANAPTLAIAPLTVHAEKEMSYLSRGAADILASRIAAGSGITVLDTSAVETAIAELNQPVNQTTARTIGESLPVDYIILGSITRLGAKFSLDLTALHISGKTPPASFFGQAADINDLIPTIDALAEKINQKLFAARPAGQAVASPEIIPPPPSPEAPSANAHPETLFKQGEKADLKPVKAVQPPTPPPAPSVDSGKASPFVVAQRAEAQSDFWKSDDFAIEACGLAVADVDGDGKNEAVIVSPDSLAVGRMESGRLEKVAEYKAGANERLLTVDAADTDNDGRAEIFVTCLRNTSQRLCSFVLSLSGDHFDLISENQNWYFRSLGDNRLIGQKRGLSEIYMSGIWRLEKNGADYVEKEEIAVPDNFSVFSFYPGDADNDGTPDLIVMDNDDKLRLYNQEDALLWKSSDYVGGSETIITDRNDKKNNSSGEQVFLPQRVIVSDINADGRNEILTVRNKAVSGRLFQKFRRYSQASFVCLSWDGLGMSEVWHTSPVSGYASDFALADIDNDGKNEIAALVVSSRGSIISKPKSALIFYEMENSPK
jgi:TolB-like protein